MYRYDPQAGNNGGASNYGASISDTNLFGYGKEAEVSWDKNVDRTRLGAQYIDPMLFDGYWNAQAGYGRTSDGNDQRLSIRRPFYSFSTPWSTELSIAGFRRDDKIYSDGVVAERFSHEMRSAMASWGWALAPSDNVANRIIGGVRLARDRESLVAGLVEQARNAASAARENLDRRIIEERLGLSARDADLVEQIVRAFFQIEGLQAGADGDALIDRAQLGPRQGREQSVLRAENDLKRLAAAALEVAQKPQLFEQIAAQVLGLVDEDQGAASPGAVVQQEIGQPQTQHLLGPLLIRQREVEEDRLQKREPVRHVAVAHQGARDVGPQTLQ